jgi:hypothetical protein
MENLGSERGGPRNVVIYSDGTGRRGGLYFDEERTNIYKLYRATAKVNPATCFCRRATERSLLIRPREKLVSVSVKHAKSLKRRWSTKRITSSVLQIIRAWSEMPLSLNFDRYGGTSPSSQSCSAAKASHAASIRLYRRLKGSFVAASASRAQFSAFSRNTSDCFIASSCCEAHRRQALVYNATLDDTFSTLMNACSDDL